MGLKSDGKFNTGCGAACSNGNILNNSRCYEMMPQGIKPAYIAGCKSEEV